ncbi:MAG TPA: helix-turn-helix domain-containing protein [Thermohalobaculum sp.]|nr:helix-turn-helix domain-containing protein [Thermohalobaculum sp.]
MNRAEGPPRSDCPISFALEIFGDRWTLIVLRDILLRGRKRYKELADCDEGIATNVLADRLKRLERRGLVRKERSAEDARQFTYQPTEMAVSLLPMLLEMTVWGLRNTDTPGGPAFLQRFETDRETLIAEWQRDIRAKAGLK